VEDMIRSLMRGKVLSVLDSTGVTVHCVATLDSKFSFLVLEYSRESGLQRRSISLQSISQIRVGERSGGSQYLAIDEFCVTLFEDEKATSFRFDDFEQRDTFACCLSLFVVDAPPLDDVLIEGWEMSGPPHRHTQAFMCGLCH